MEEQDDSSGFVHFKAAGSFTTARANKPQTVPTIPEHLRANLPDPLAHLSNKKPPAAASSTSAAKAGDSSERLKVELAKLQAKREETAARLKAMTAKAKASSAARLPPPPPSLA